MNNPLIIAHRGASQAAPENTLAAIRLAWEMGCDAVEVDIRLTRDRQIAVMHDPTTGRTAGVDYPVASLSLAELQKLDAGSFGSFKGEAWKGEAVPSLREVLETVPDGKRIVIEIKDTRAILPPLKEALEASRLEPGQIVLILFNYELALETRALFPENSVLWLTDAYRGSAPGEWPRLTRELGEMARRGKFDGINVGTGGAVPAELLIAELRALLASGLQVWTWTVNDPELGRRLLEVPVCGITSDAPDLFLSLRNQPAI